MRDQKEIEDEIADMPPHFLETIYHYMTGNRNDTHDYSEPSINPVFATVYPIFIIQYAVLAVIGIVTNAAVIVYVMRYKLYREVPHAFLVNLSVCYFVQCTFVLPMSLSVLLLRFWIFGQFLCFFLPLLQDIPLHVAILTHILIAWDRMRWLSDPLKGRLPAFVCSCATWLTGMVIALPYPIYITYLDLGLYMKNFRGVGICAVNLVDDMHEYMRGLFVIMYCAPTTILAYMYIRTSRELRPPEGPIAIMMFEQRAEIRNRQKDPSNLNHNRATRQSSTRSYDLYDAELDVTREKRTQRHLGSMAATQVICVCPLMIMRFARMLLVETYENTALLDMAYLMFVWIAFLPSVINPWIYGSWVLSRHAKERLRGYFRLSSNRRQNSKISEQPSCEDSGVQENSTEISTNQRDSIDDSSDKKTLTSIQIISDVKTVKRLETIKAAQKPILPKIVTPEYMGPVPPAPVSNNGSNITSSTYCNVGDYENALYYDKKPLCDRDSVCSSAISAQTPIRPSFRRSRDLASERDAFSRKDSTSTLERDLEIIDLLERERSMDIQEMIEHEKRMDALHNSASRQGSHRRLPDISRLTQQKVAALHGSDFSNYSNIASCHAAVGGPGTPSTTAVGDVLASRISSRKSSHSSQHTKRDSLTSCADSAYDSEQRYTTPRDSRITRTRGSGSSRTSMKSRRITANGDFRENSFTQEL